ncbi:MAG: glycine cleavage system aminomethyltransferase GcvT [Gammaproteobacteria bacterium]|nr:glycine cleavage system aminomethyltransferase GcvT [Gammaproteobacteria bacterium]
MPALTPLHSAHIAHHARMVDFHGWHMPLHYGSQIQEHHAVRKDAGIFDVSHMTILDILGTGGRQFLRKLLTNDIDHLAHPGTALYSCMCNEHGGILDDLIVYQRASDNHRLILNSATRQKDLDWIQQKSQGFALGLQVRPELAIIAVQGPQAIQKLLTLLPQNEADAISTLRRFECVDVDERFFARTGYTGEDGFEIMLPDHQALAFWQSLIDAGFTPCGLAARDSLRLEAGYLLYGQDMDESTNPLESGLGWTVKWSPQDRDFIGMGALLSEQQTLQRKMVGLTLIDPGVLRAAQSIFIPNQPNGITTSGGFSPTLNQSIALARVPIDTPPVVEVDIRGKRLQAKVGPPRFYSSPLTQKDPTA